MKVSKFELRFLSFFSGSVIVDDIGEEDLSKVACVVNKGADVSNCKVCLKRKEGDEKDYNVDSIGRLLANKLKMAENGS